jgi:hypothetical protein
MNWGGTILGSLAGGGLGGLVGSGALGGSGGNAGMGALLGAGAGGLLGAGGMPATTSGVAGMLPALMMAKKGQQQPPMQQPGAMQPQFSMPQMGGGVQYGAGSPGYQNALAQALAQYQG